MGRRIASRAGGWALAVLLATAGALAAATAPAVADDQAQCTRDQAKLIDRTPPALALMGIASARQLSLGAGVRVAVVDSGVDARNPHLRGVVDPGKDFVSPGGDGTKDSYGGGTAVAAQIAAAKVSGSGVVGVAPSARIVPVRVYQSLAQSEQGPTWQRTAAGIRWAADQPDVKVIVVPQPTGSDHAGLRSAVAYATGRGALVVASAGDAAKDATSTVLFPAGYPDVLAVTAVDPQGNAADSVQHGVDVELAAPGAQVLTAAFDTGDCEFATSSASAYYASGYAAGVAALVAAAHPDEKPADWEYRLLVTALRPAGADRNQTVGWGLVAPYDAINLVNDGTLSGPKNPRFPAPEESVPPAMVPPVTPVDTSTGVVLPVAAILLGAGVLVVAALLMRRVRA